MKKVSAEMILGKSKSLRFRKSTKTILVKAWIPAGEAKITPPLGPVLGQHGVNIVEFCSAYNDRTKDFDQGLILPVLIYVSPLKTFLFEIKTPTLFHLLQLALDFPKGRDVNKKTMSKIRAKGKTILKTLFLSSLIKFPNTNDIHYRSLVKSFIGTCKSFGLTKVRKYRYKIKSKKRK